MSEACRLLVLVILARDLQSAPDFPTRYVHLIGSS